MIWLSVLACAWSLAFWYIFIVKIAHEVYGVPLGLGGAVYPVFFLPVVFGGTSLYAGVIRWLLPARSLSNLRLSFVGLGVPILIATLGLLVFCPTDGPGESFLELLWRRL